MTTTPSFPFTVVGEDTNGQVFIQWTSATSVAEAAEEVGRHSHVEQILAIFPGQVTNLYDPETIGTAAEGRDLPDVADGDDEGCVECLDKGWDVFNADEHRHGEIQRCDTCRRLPDDSAAFEAARSAGYLLDEEGGVLMPPPSLELKASWTEGRLDGRAILTVLGTRFGIETLGCIRGTAYVRSRLPGTEPNAAFPGVHLTHVTWEISDNGGELMVEPVNQGFFAGYRVEEGIPYTCFSEVLDPQTMAYRVSCRIKGREIDWRWRFSDQG